MRGESVYRTNCQNCHGAKGQGDGPVADSLTLRPADLTTEIVQKKSENELLKIIREGKPGTSMPSWKGELSAQHIQDVLAYLRGFGVDPKRGRGTQDTGLRRGGRNLVRITNPRQSPTANHE